MTQPIADVNDVLIVGGGVGGLSLAIMLLERGVPVRIIDSDPEWGAVGAGLTVNGMTLRAFAELGIMEAVRGQAHIHGGRRYLDAAGEVVSDTPAYTPEEGDLAAGGGILRPALHAILKERALSLGVEAVLGTRVKELQQRDDHVLVALEDGSEHRPGLVVGADGLRSTIRRLIFPDAPPPRFTGQGAWRAVFPRPAEVETSWSIIGGKYKGVGLNPISDTHMYLHLLESVPDNPWLAEEEWPRLLAERLGSYSGLLGRLSKTLNADSLINYRPLETLLLPPPWHVGRVVLIGDAAHSTTPHSAYGAGLAAEDAIVLAKVLGHRGGLDERLRAYADLRFERCRDVVEAALRIGEIEMRDGPHDEWQAAFLRLRERIWRPMPSPGGPMLGHGRLSGA